MIREQAIIGLRMERQFLSRQANEQEYLALYRDTQPGQNVYWNGFGDPPSITFRASFDDKEYNRRRQAEHKLVKGRFFGTLGWIVPEDMELFACLCKKPLRQDSWAQKQMLELIRQEGPVNIQMIKEMTGMLVKEITPLLHRLQEAFLVFEDQFDGQWDRGWCLLTDMFPEISLDRYTKQEALEIILQRFAYRNVWFDIQMAKSFYRLPLKDLQAAAEGLLQKGITVEHDGGYLMRKDLDSLKNNRFSVPKGVFAMHRNDFLVKSNEYWLKKQYRHPDYDNLQYLLVDGCFEGVVLGHFKNGPYVIEDVFVEEKHRSRKQEILAAVGRVNPSDKSPVQRFCGRNL